MFDAKAAIVTHTVKGRSITVVIDGVPDVRQAADHVTSETLDEHIAALIVGLLYEHGNRPLPLPSQGA